MARLMVVGEVIAPYRAGYLALLQGPLLELAVRGTKVAPDVLLVDASGRDHPRVPGWPCIPVRCSTCRPSA